jgi:hypothetical protein
MHRAVSEVIAAERRRGVGYLIAVTLLVGSGSAAIAWAVVHGWPRRSGRPAQPGGQDTGLPAG